MISIPRQLPVQNFRDSQKTGKTAVDNMTTNANDPKQRDNIREKKLQAIRILDDFLAAACDPSFVGSLNLELHAKDGKVGRVKHSKTVFERD